MATEQGLLLNYTNLLTFRLPDQGLQYTYHPEWKYKLLGLQTFPTTMLLTIHLMKSYNHRFQTPVLQVYINNLPIFMLIIRKLGSKIDISSYLEKDE